MLLENKNAVIYGGGGAIGGAVARAFAREGATVHLAGRTEGSLAAVADQIRAAGGTARTTVLDALDQAAVDHFADAVAADAGSVDISFSVISLGEVFGTPLAQMKLEDVERPVTTALRSLFLTSRAAARHMIEQGSGVILTFGGYGDPMANLGGFQVAFGAVEALRRSLALELGPHGIRVLTLQTGGVPESLPPDLPEKARDAITQDVTRSTMLKRPATLDDIGNVAAFVASDRARAMTGTAVNVTAGSVVD